MGLSERVFFWKRFTCVLDKGPLIRFLLLDAQTLLHRRNPFEMYVKKIYSGLNIVCFRMNLYNCLTDFKVFLYQSLQ